MHVTPLAWILTLVILLAVLQAPGAVLVVVVLVGVLAVGAIAAWVARGPVIIRLDAVGYQARVRRGHGVRAARWSDLKDAVTAFEVYLEIGALEAIRRHGFGFRTGRLESPSWSDLKKVHEFLGTTIDPEPHATRLRNSTR